MIQQFSEFKILNEENIVGGRRGKGKRRRKRSPRAAKFAGIDFSTFSGFGGNCPGMETPPVLDEEAIQMEVAELESIALETMALEDDADLAIVLIGTP